MRQRERRGESAESRGKRRSNVVKHEIMAGLCNLALGCSSLARISFPLGLLLTHVHTQTYCIVHTFWKTTKNDIYIENNEHVLFHLSSQSLFNLVISLWQTLLTCFFMPLFTHFPIVLHWLLLHWTKPRRLFPLFCLSESDRQVYCRRPWASHREIYLLLLPRPQVTISSLSAVLASKALSEKQQIGPEGFTGLDGCLVKETQADQAESAAAMQVSR